MNDPLEGLDDQERQWLQEIAENEGITLRRARAKRDELARHTFAAYDQAIEHLARKKGVAPEELKAKVRELSELDDSYRKFARIYGHEYKGLFSQMLEAEHGRKMIGGRERASQAREGKLSDLRQAVAYLSAKLDHDRQAIIAEIRRDTIAYGSEFMGDLRESLERPVKLQFDEVPEKFEELPARSTMLVYYTANDKQKTASVKTIHRYIVESKKQAENQ